MTKYWSELTKGIVRENPLLVLLLGLCPSLAVTTSVQNGIGMGLAATFVLVCSNVVISMIRNIIPPKVRIPAFIVVIASFVTIVDLVLHAYMYDLWKSLGLFIPLIVVNCIILGRAEAFASRNSVFLSFLDGIGMGLGFTFALILLSSIREILGNGSFAGIKLFGESFEPAVLMILPPGAFITLGFIVAGVNKLNSRKKKEGE
ncbi:MAG: electron transport complex subunit E [Acidobacteria bacterium]|nr:electron transport complex subunit E [Acidobacteriota bacterium]